jgi:hypothetical protein
MNTKTMESNTFSKTESIEISIKTNDSIIVDYFYEIPKEHIEKEAIEALKVGIIAIRSASPNLDTRIVEEKFQEVENSISNKLEKYFQEKAGYVPLTLNEFLGENGKLNVIIDKKIGPASDFAKKLDPSNRESVICLLEGTVKNILNEASKEVIKEFSFDNEQSSVIKLREALIKEINKLKEDNTKYFVELKEGLGILKGQAEEAKKGTKKGKEFQEAIYDYLAEICGNVDDACTFVANTPGIIPRCKVGDITIELGEGSGAKGEKIAIEIKGEENYSIEKAKEEAKVAKENRNASICIFIFEKGIEPDCINDFHKYGDDFYITVERNSLDNQER